MGGACRMIWPLFYESVAPDTWTKKLREDLRPGDRVRFRTQAAIGGQFFYHHIGVVIEIDKVRALVRDEYGEMHNISGRLDVWDG